MEYLLIFVGHCMTCDFSTIISNDFYCNCRWRCVCDSSTDQYFVIFELKSAPVYNYFSKNVTNYATYCLDFRPLYLL